MLPPNLLRRIARSRIESGHCQPLTSQILLARVQQEWVRCSIFGKPNITILMGLIGEIGDPPSQQTIPPVTLRVSGHDEGDKPTCVFRSEICSDPDSYFVLFFSTKRSSLPSSTLNQPPRVPMSSSRSDLSSSRIRFPSRMDTYNASHVEEQRVQRESKLERYV